MQFKYEIFLLLTAIALFAASAFLYSYPTYQEGFALAEKPLNTFEYQGFAFSFVGFGSFLMVTASISFVRRSKTAGNKLTV